MTDVTTAQLLAEAEKDINRVSGLTEAIKDEVAAVRDALSLLRQSSSANFSETIVYRVIQKLETAVVSLESKSAGYEQEILQILRRIAKRESPPPPSTSITTFQIQQENPMVSIAPGNSPVFTATPVPATSVPSTPPTWTSSDTTNAPITVDPTGLIATVAIPSTAVVGTSFTLEISYTNADGTVATGSTTQTIVSAPSPDITSFTIEQTQ
jgi:hypothetical protein